MDIRITHIFDLSPNLVNILGALVREGASAGTTDPIAYPTDPVAVEHPAEINMQEHAAAAMNGASPSDATVDAHGHPWSAELHASTKGTTKDGLWRMKIGVARPAPMPGFSTDGPAAADPNASSGSTSTGSTGAAASTPSEAAASEPVGTAVEDDEFAAFRTAAAESDAADAAAIENIPARKWTDADLGALCNQAATKLGDPTPIKELIAEFVKEGEVPHSRNIDDTERAAFAAAVELKAGIEFAG